MAASKRQCPCPAHSLWAPKVPARGYLTELTPVSPRALPGGRGMAGQHAGSQIHGVNDRWELVDKSCGFLALHVGQPVTHTQPRGARGPQ